MLKKERVQDFVMDARRDLYRLWDKLYFSIAERHAFEPAFQAVFNDQTLEMHEAEIERLKLLAEDRKYILEKVEEHMKLLDEIHEFEEQAKNPARLFNRGGRDPGRLLREEKFRRRVAKQLPKVKKELKGALQEYQIMNGTPFCVNGEPYIHHLDADQSKKVQRKREGNRESTCSCRCSHISAIFSTSVFFFYRRIVPLQRRPKA